MFRLLVTLTVTASVFLSGCVANAPFPDQEREETEFVPQTLGLAPDFSYEIPKENPGIQVDRLGYLPGSSKTAVFRGENLPEHFQVIAKDSGEYVYEGDIIAKEETADGISTGYGSFTGLQEEGTYYIQCEKIGCSYYFDIRREAYLEKAAEYGEIVQGMQNAGEPQETVAVCQTVSYLLAAYEMYPELLTELWDAGNTNAAGEAPEVNAEEFFRMLRQKTDLLLTVQDEKTGGIFTDVEKPQEQENVQETEREIGLEATAAFAGTMAKYSYLYQDYDWDYANICLKAAAKAWRYLDKALQRDSTLKNSMENGRIYAASELYRASNERLYHNYILQNQELIAGGKEDPYLLMGKVTYLSTRRKVDHELCGLIMDSLMKNAEKIAADQKEGLFFIQTEETEAMLWDMTKLAFANYAIMNHEYTTVIENGLHYLFGRNEEGAFLLEDPGSTEAARVLFLLSVVETERKIMETSMEAEQ